MMGSMQQVMPPTLSLSLSLCTNTTILSIINISYPLDSFVWCAQSTRYTTQSHYLLWLYCHTFTLTNSSQLIFPARIHYTATGLLVT